MYLNTFKSLSRSKIYYYNYTSDLTKLKELALDYY